MKSARVSAQPLSGHEGENVTEMPLPRELLAAENFSLRQLLVQAGVDAREHEATEKLQRLLVEELHHRVTNTLATVSAIASQSLRTARSMEEGRQAIESRLMALGMAHDLLLQACWASANVSHIVRDAIKPYDAGDGRFVVQGANVEVGARAVLALALTLNELCTNATKYGALSTAGGHVEIAWKVTTVNKGLRRFELRWTEKGGPTVHAPTRRSFGTRLIETLGTQLNGDIRLTFDPKGVVYEFHAPLTALGAAI